MAQAPKGGKSEVNGYLKTHTYTDKNGQAREVTELPVTDWEIHKVQPSA